MFSMYKILVSLVVAFLLAGPASAAIITVQEKKSCQVTGLDTSTASVRGGVHCDTGDVGFSLTDLLSGQIGLLVGDSKTPSWNVLNDTGSAVTQLALYYSGALAQNSFIDMQVSNGIFEACRSDDGTVVNSDSNCGSGDKTVKPEDGGKLPVLLTWSGGNGVAAGETFNIKTASFASAGQDAGCISGTSDCEPGVIPLPASFWLFLASFGFLGLTGGRKKIA